MSYPLLQVKIELDTEKICREKKWSLYSMIETIDKIALQCGLVKQDELCYKAQGNEQDLTSLSLFNFHHLANQEWFTENVKKWDFFDEYEGCTDLIALSKEKDHGAC